MSDIVLGARETGRHPGAANRRGRSTPKGRQVDSHTRHEILDLLADKPRRRDLLIEHLHLIQDRYLRISTPHLAALADEMRMALAEVYEVATFYAHFHVTDDAAPSMVIRVCESISCMMAGGDALAAAISAGTDARVVRAPCIGRCDYAPVAEVGHNLVDHATAAEVLSIAARHETHPRIGDYVTYEAYVATGGYISLNHLLSGELTADEILDRLDGAKLAGLGGAGFPTGRKWRTVRDQPGTKLMVVNGDEGEPGTFKDRFYLERDPHRFIEGMLIAARIVGAEEIYIYLRDEYPAGRQILHTEIAKLPVGAGPKIHLRRGAGAYICGEESAMIESIEGKRGLPRHKPPFIFQEGLFGQPTLANNVETLWWVRDLLEHGPDWWIGQGRHGRIGLRSYSVSGRVKKPGVKLAPAGITLRELVDEYCEGMADGHTLRGYLPGGASGGIMPARLDDVPLDFGTLEKHGCFIGSAAVVVLSDHDDMRAVALNLMRFFQDESCGQCTPCRVGTEKAVALMSQPEWDQPLLGELAAAMRDASICGLGQAAPNPLLTLMRYFPKEFAA